MDSVIVHGNRVQSTRFLFMELEPKGLDFHSATSLKFKHSQQITQIHSNPNIGPHSRSLFKPKYTQTQTPILSLSLFKPSLSLFKPRTTPSPHSLSLSLFKPCPNYSTSSLFKTLLSLFKPSLSLSLSFKPRAAPLLHLITLQTLTLTLQTSHQCLTSI